MDRDWGAKSGAGGVASGQSSNIDRRERLRQLALETIDITKVNNFPQYAPHHNFLNLGSLFYEKPSWIL